jgi:hypothetical protein
MSTRILAPMLPTEQLVAVDPPLQQQLASLKWWQRRLRMFTGRALSDVALSAEQDYRSGHLVRAGELLSPGVVDGLVLDLDPSGASLRITAGLGIAVSGEDVMVPLPLSVKFDDLSVFVAQTTSSTGTGPSDTVSPKFADWKKSITPPAVGIVVLQPITFAIAGKAADAASETIDITQELLLSPDRDPEAYAFEDWQVLDGCRPVFYPWPTDDTTLAIPSSHNLDALAQEVFAKEAGLGRDEHFPWQDVGVPLAVVAFDNTWKAISVDRSSVVRQGGMPRLTLSAPFDKSWPAPNFLLAEARIGEYLEVGAVALETKIPSDIFQVLPPVGLLPPRAIDLANAADPTKLPDAATIKPNSTFPIKNVDFPKNYTVSAAPILMEEIDSFVDESAELAPFDLTVADEVEILVPVPAASYDPQLLSLEPVAADFQTEMDQAKSDRILALQHCGDLENKANVFLKLLATNAIPVDTDPNNPNVPADEKADLKAAGNTYKAPDTEAFGTEVDASTKLLGSVDVDGLKSAAASLTVTAGGKATPLISPDALKIIDSQGLQAFIDALQASISRANDVLDSGFARSQTDIYRYRQLMLGSNSATRLATSPVLAQIAQGTVATSTADQLNQFLKSAAATKQSAPSNPSWQKGLISNIGNVVTAQTFSVGGGVGIRSAAMVDALRVPAPSPVQPVGVTKAPGTISKIPSGATNVFADTVSRSVSDAVAAVAATPPSAGDVQQQAPLVGAQYALRTMSIVERLAESASLEAAYFTGQNRGEIMTSILALGNAPATPPLPVPLVVDDLPVEWIGTDGKAVTVTLADVRSGKTPIDQVKTVPIAADSDEASIFSAGIHGLEQHTGLLRALEGRVAQYTQFVTQAKQALASVQSNLGHLDLALKAAEDALDNARHHYTFIKALYNDELARVNGVNQRRANTLVNDVKFLVYRLSRQIAATVDEPSRELLPLVSATAVPACLNRTAPIPPELRQMVNLLRNAPAAWIPDFLTPLINFERPDLLFGLATRMQAAAQLAGQLPVASTITLDSSAYADQINFAYSTHRSVLESFRVQRASFPVANLQGQAWSAHLAALQPIVTCGDLLASELGNLVTRPIARKLDEITAVAACIYDRVSAVTPDLRLAWADLFYQEGDTADLHDLSVLPRWGEVPYVQRNETQQLVSWLFAQVNQSIAPAKQFISDVVRVAILLASHAPVSEIIQGEVLEQQPLRIGINVRVSLPSLRIYQSMPVVLHENGEIFAHGMVNDLSASDASVQITSVVQAATNVSPSKTSVQFVTQQNWTNAVSEGNTQGAPRAMVKA